jgi:hypothetical protein
LSSPFPLFSTITAPPLSIRSLQPHDLSPMRARPAAVSSPPGSAAPPRHPPCRRSPPVRASSSAAPRGAHPSAMVAVRAELASRPWRRLARSSFATGPISSDRPRRSLAPRVRVVAVLQLHQDRAAGLHSPPPRHLACAQCPNGPHRGQCWQRAHAAGDEAGKLGFPASSLRNCSREHNLRWFRCCNCFCEPLWHNFVENSCRSSSGSCVKRDPYSPHCQRARSGPPPLLSCSSHLELIVRRKSMSQKHIGDLTLTGPTATTF